MKLHEIETDGRQGYSNGLSYPSKDLELGNLNVIILGKYTGWGQPHHQPQIGHSYEIRYIRLFSLFKGHTVREFNVGVDANDGTSRLMTLKMA